MFQLKNYKFLTLYFSSIGLTQSIKNLIALIKLPLINEDKLRLSLHKKISTKFCGNPVFSYSSARASLAAFLNSIEVEQEDEILISSFTCLAVPNAVINSGATPKYYDVDPITMNLDLKSLEKGISNRTKVIVIQHTLGVSVPVNEIKLMLPRKDIIILEDCALSIGSNFDGKFVGTNADAAFFSLELSKTITCGWGGILILNNKKLEHKVRKNYELVGDIKTLKSIRMSIQTSISGLLYSSNFYFIGKYFILLFFKIGLFGPSTSIREEKGDLEDDFISKLPKSLLTLAIIQIERFDEIINAHEKNSIIIRDNLDKLKYRTLGVYPENFISVSPRIPILVKDRASFINFFKKKGIEVGTWFDGPLSPLPTKPKFKYDKFEYPNAYFISKHIVNLPCHSKMKNYHLNLVERSLKEYALKNPDHSNLNEHLNY